MSLEEFKRIVRARVLSVENAEIDVSQIDKPGSALNILAVDVAGSLAEECDARSAARIASRLAATSNGNDLDVTIAELSHGKLARKTATASKIVLYMSRPAPVVGDSYLKPGTEILAGGLTFKLDHGVNFADAQTGKQAVYGTCTTLGSNTCVSFTSAAFKRPAELDTDYTISLFLTPPSDTEQQTVFSVGGDDREGDEDFKARFAVWDAGTDRNLDFIKAGALAIPGIKYAEAIERLSASGVPTGAVDLYVGDANGRANAALVEKVRAQSRNFRLPGQAVFYYGTNPSIQTIVLLFGILDGYTQQNVIDQAIAAVVEAVNKIKPGKTFYRSIVQTALQSVDGVVLLDAAPYGCTTPAADVVPSSGSTTFRTSAEKVSFG